MIYLIFVSFIWAFSFGLIKTNLAALDPNFIATARLLISFVVLLPFLKIKKISFDLAIKLFIVGTIQFGVMYIAYLHSFKLLLAHEVAFFTILTPLYVTFIDDLFEKRFQVLFFLTSLAAIFGTYIILDGKIEQNDYVIGFLLVQLSNLCFAFGQIAYKKIMADEKKLSDKYVFGILYLGGLFVTAFIALFTTSWHNLHLSLPQTATLLYLGAIASGLCFFLWNYGARKTNSGALAILNNLKIPLAILCALIFFGEKTDGLRLGLGCTIMGLALFYNERYLRNHPKRCI